MASHPPKSHVETDLPDLGHRRLADLVKDDDPVLAASLAELASLLHRSSAVHLGWTSAIDVE